MTSVTYRSVMSSHDVSAGFVEATWKARGKDSFERSWNLPELGVGVSWTDQSAVAFNGWDQRLDDLYALYAVMRRDFGRGERVRFGYDFDLGTAYTGNVFDFSDGYNWYYGTHFVCFVQAGAHVGVSLSPRVEALAEARVMHASNGRLGYPNQGMNFAGVGVGLRYSFGGCGAARGLIHTPSMSEDPCGVRGSGVSSERVGSSSLCERPRSSQMNCGTMPLKDQGSGVQSEAHAGGTDSAFGRVKISPDEYRRGWSLEIQAGGGVHTCGTEFVATYRCGDSPSTYSGLRRWPKASVSADILYRYSGRWSTGVIADLFYSSNTSALKGFDTTIYGSDAVASSKGYAPFSTGVGIVQMLHYKNVCAVLSPAVYIYRRMGIRDDHGMIYNRAGLRWYIHGGPFYVGAVIKAQPFKAEYFDFHVGWRLPS